MCNRKILLVLLFCINIALAEEIPKFHGKAFYSYLGSNGIGDSGGIGVTYNFRESIMLGLDGSLWYRERGKLFSTSLNVYYCTGLKNRVTGYLGFGIGARRYIKSGKPITYNTALLQLKYGAAINLLETYHFIPFVSMSYSFNLSFLPKRYYTESIRLRRLMEFQLGAMIPLH